MEFLKEQNLLNVEEEILYNHIGREFICLIETTNMTKVYKMPLNIELWIIIREGIGAITNK